MIDILFLQAAAEDELTWQTAWIAMTTVLGGILLVTTIVTVLIWQIGGAWRARMLVSREDAYRKLAEESAGQHARAAGELERTAIELAGLHQRTAELERLLKEVE